MADTDTFTGANPATPPIDGVGVDANASSHFAAAVEQAKAGAQVLGKQAQEQAEVYKQKLVDQKDVLTAQAKDRSDEVIDRVLEFANDGKARASDALSKAGKLVEDNATLIDERAGAQYGDYVRTFGKSLQGYADQLDSKDLNELSDDFQEFVRARPALSVGLAAASGFLLSRMFSGSKD